MGWGERGFWRLMMGFMRAGLKVTWGVGSGGSDGATGRLSKGSGEWVARTDLVCGGLQTGAVTKGSGNWTCSTEGASSPTRWAPTKECSGTFSSRDGALRTLLTGTSSRGSTAGEDRTGRESTNGRLVLATKGTLWTDWGRGEASGISTRTLCTRVTSTRTRNTAPARSTTQTVVTCKPSSRTEVS